MVKSQRLTGVFSQLSSRKALVIGDFLLDTYTIGKARRISPEAPVAVIHVQREEKRPGGAGNVALNLISLGAQVVAVGRIGSDVAGQMLLESLSSEGINTSGIRPQAEYPTPVKNRILAENQQIVRVDYELISPISKALEQEIVENLPRLLEGIDIVAISDYGKGFLSRHLLKSLISLAQIRKIPVVTDPKGIDFTKYAGSTVLKPNLGEAYAAANLVDPTLDEVAERILQTTNAHALMITRSEAGISIFDQDGSRNDFPVRVREVKDVTGAGDTVLAMLTCAIANGLPVVTAARLSNVAAGIAIERLGCARVTLSQLARRLLEEDVANKIFDDEHLFALKEALRDRSYVILSVDSKKGVNSSLFKAIQQLAQNNERELVLYISDSEPDSEIIQLLASLREVNFILLKGENVLSLRQSMAPEGVYSIVGGICVKGKGQED